MGSSNEGRIKDNGSSDLRDSGCYCNSGAARFSEGRAGVGEANEEIALRRESRLRVVTAGRGAGCECTAPSPYAT